MPIYTVSKITQVAGSFRCTPLTYEWTDRLYFAGMDDVVDQDPPFITNNFNAEAFLQIDEIPAVGDTHNVYDDTCCVGVTITNPPDNKGRPSTDAVYADVSWLRARMDRDNNRTRQIIMEPYQVQEVRNFDVNGDRTRVFYNLANPDPRFPSYRIADIRVPRSLHSVRFVQYENFSGQDMGTAAEPFLTGFKLPLYNKTAWNGFEKNTLLFIGRRIFSDGVPICRVEYHFLTNDRGWNKFIAVYTQQNGYAPKELADLGTDATDPFTDASDIQKNGIGAFDMLESASFGSILQELADVNM